MADWCSQEVKRSSGGPVHNSVLLFSFVCLLPFLLGWVPSNPTYVFGLFYFLLMAWQKKKSHCFDISWHPPLSIIKAPGLLNKLICGHSWVVSTLCMYVSVCLCACVYVYLFSVLNQRGSVVSRTLAVSSSTAFCLAVEAHVFVCTALTHTNTTDIQSLVPSILRTGFILALNSVGSCPNVWTSIKAKYSSTTRKMPSEIAWMCHGGDWADHICSMHFLTYIICPFVRPLSGAPCYLHVSLLSLCFFYAWNCWLAGRH